MKKIYKSLSVILTLIMILSAVPITASAATYSGTCGDNLTWAYDTTTCTLTISGTGEMKNYSSDNRPWEDYEDSIRKVVIENGVTTIGKYAFYNCESIYNVSVGNSVTVIGDSSFLGCISLESINIPNTVKKIERYGFQTCRSLKSIVIPSGVESIGAFSFAYCKKLESVTLCSGLKEILAMSFIGCESLKTLFLPETLTKIGTMTFVNCKSLVSITVDSKNPYFSSDKYGVLYNKEKTEILQYPAGNTRTSYEIIDSVTIVGDYSFVGSSYIEKVTIPEGVTLIDGNAFNGCINLSDIEIPESVTTIEQEAFANCKSIKTFELSKNIISIDNSTFVRCSGLTNITVDEENQYYSSDECGVLFNKDKTAIIKYPAKSLGTSYTVPDTVTLIDYCAFEYCNNLISVTIPDSVKTIYSCAFAWSENIEFLIMGTGVEKIGYAAFDSCNSITDIYYCGTSSQWDDVYVDYLNDCLLNARIHYNYCIHKFDNWSIVTAPTCTNLGYEKGECTNCGMSKIREIDALNHDYEETVTSPTCTESGYTIYTCHCGDTYKTNEIPAKGHVYESVITPPTCTERGYTTYTCFCGDSYKGDYTSAEGHVYNSVIIPPTCIEKGYTTYTCECGDSYIADYVDEKGHDYKITATKPTCTEKGYTTNACSSCGDIYIDNYKGATGHDYDNGIVTTKPTCTKAGVKTFTCANCGDTYTEEIDALGHTSSDAGEENYVAPTCTEKGSKDIVVYCLVCDEEISRETVVIDATGHADNDGDGYCDMDNEVLDPTVECNCNCHKSGITKFFFNFIIFFQKLFGSNKICACGVAHY